MRRARKDECALNAEGHCLLRTWGIEHLEGASVSEETVHVPTRVDKSTDDFTFVIAAESYGVNDEGDIVGFFPTAPKFTAS